MTDLIIALPTDILVEIFSHWKSGYSQFRCLNRASCKVIVSWDGWDALFDQGIRVNISGKEIWWYKNNEIHREGDLPAIERTNGRREWYKKGERHRLGDLPAIEHKNGSKEWWVNNQRHRENDLPAVEMVGGHKKWYRNGCWSRKDPELPVVINEFGRGLMYSWSKEQCANDPTWSRVVKVGEGMWCSQKPPPLRRFDHFLKKLNDRVLDTILPICWGYSVVMLIGIILTRKQV